MPTLIAIVDSGWGGRRILQRITAISANLSGTYMDDRISSRKGRKNGRIEAHSSSDSTRKNVKNLAPELGERQPCTGVDELTNRSCKTIIK
jgi:hypothetical protein